MGVGEERAFSSFPMNLSAMRFSKDREVTEESDESRTVETFQSHRKKIQKFSVSRKLRKTLWTSHKGKGKSVHW